MSLPSIVSKTGPFLCCSGCKIDLFLCVCVFAVSAQTPVSPLRLADAESVEQLIQTPIQSCTVKTHKHTAVHRPTLETLKNRGVTIAVCFVCVVRVFLLH